MVNIREYYEDKNSGNMLPGKKGIALSIAQYQTFVTLLPEIEAALLAKGETVPRPEYGAAAPAAAARAKDGEGDEVEAEVEGEGKEGKGEKRNGKRNFEATSDEEE